MVIGMNVVDEDVVEFMRLWKEEFKETISEADARHCASQVLELYAMLAKPLPGELSQTGESHEPQPTRT